uniref:Kinesin motor domain-containing protein n=1 Tax=Oryza meridionalis TaxID=40149 RepID=A0A0E0DD62_9ORYZ
MEQQQQQQEPSGGGVRVVARICPCAPPPPPPDAALNFQVAALNDPALISFLPRRPTASAATAAASGRGDGPKDKQPQQQKQKYRVDGCYLRDDPNHRVFHNEVKPLIDGRGGGGRGGAKACVVACGDAAAKRHLFMGSPDQPGLFTMAMAQLLDSSKAIGATVTVSSYQVLQDTHILDLLEPKNHEVLILEDADGQTHLKGLSRVGVKSIEEFSQLSCCATNQQRHHPAKDSTQLQDWGHQGLIIYVSSFDQQGKECALAKINFLNLAGYVDPKQKKNEGLALPTGNKSMHALMNVVQALNSNQRFVPYRQSKVTRILQDSLCKSKTSGSVLIACLAEDCCQDSVSTLGLASRSSQVVNEQYYSLSLSAKKSSKSNTNLPTDAKTLSRMFMHKTMSMQEKNARPGFNNSGVKGGQTPTANRRTQPIIGSTKKSGSSICTSIKMKENYAKPKISGRKLFCPSNNSLKEENAMDVASTVVTQTKSATVRIQAEEVQPLVGMEIRAALPNEGSSETGNTGDVKSFELQEVVHCSTKELLPSTIQEEDYALSNMEPEHSCTDMGLTCSSITDNLVEKTPASSTQSSPKLSDRLREISNSLKLLSTRPVSVRAEKWDIECVRRINTIAPEPKTPEVHLKFEQAEDPKDKLTARSTGIKVNLFFNSLTHFIRLMCLYLLIIVLPDEFSLVFSAPQKSLVQECLTFLNSANKEQLKSLKGIGEKRANYILELREESPELFKEISDLRDIIGMNSKEIKKMMSGIIDS